MHTKLLVIAALLSVGACSQATENATDYSPGEAGTVDHALCLLGFAAFPLRPVAPGHHLVEARINGVSGNFVLDTGANVSVINEGDAEHFGISGDAAGLAGFGQMTPVAGAGSATFAQIDSFEIGTMEVRQDSMIVADLGQLLGSLSQVSGQNVAGLIGQDVLEEHRAIIDVARPMLYLMAEDANPAPVPPEECTDAGNNANSSSPEE